MSGGAALRTCREAQFVHEDDAKQAHAGSACVKDQSVAVCGSFLLKGVRDTVPCIADEVGPSSGI